MEAAEANSGYYGFRKYGFITDLSHRVRLKIYHHFLQRFGDVKAIADVGTTSETNSKEANVLEANYPHVDRITAIGIESGAHLENVYKGLKYVQVEAGKPLPFKAGHFNVTYSHAVIEHIVDHEARIEFVKELQRVGGNVFLTTPNKYFPVETHTMVPLVHFMFPQLFNWLLDKGYINKFYRTSNLKLLNKKDLVKLAQDAGFQNFEIVGVKVFGITSNWILIIRGDPIELSG